MDEVEREPQLTKLLPDGSKCPYCGWAKHTGWVSRYVMGEDGYDPAMERVFCNKCHGEWYEAPALKLARGATRE